MKHCYKLEPLTDTAVSFGFFDGMHLGHMSVLKELAERSAERKLTPVLLSYAPEGKVLTTEEEKAMLAEKAGIGTMISLPGAPENAEALVKALVHELGARLLVIGEGATVAGLDDAELRQAAQRAGLEVCTAAEATSDGTRITTELLNEVFQRCDFERYTALCGHPYVMLGKVEHGKALGRTVGMPTANLGVGEDKRMPLDGVYATITRLPDGKYMGLTNIGKRPSVDNENRVTIETNLFDFSRDIYGVTTCLEVHFHIRGVIKFNGLKEVQEQVQKDILSSRQKLASIFSED